MPRRCTRVLAASSCLASSIQPWIHGLGIDFEGVPWGVDALLTWDDSECVRSLSCLREGHPPDASAPWPFGGFCGVRRPESGVVLVVGAGEASSRGGGGSTGLVAEHVPQPGDRGANPNLKTPSLVAGMVAGVESIEDLGLLHHGGMETVFGGLRAPLSPIQVGLDSPPR